MRGNFDACLAQILEFEGGKSDDPRDPGGRTNQGITYRTYSAYRRENALALRDVFQMTAAERNEIYREGYWDKIGGDALPSGMDLAVFDFAVNSGPGRAKAMSAKPSSGALATDIRLLCADRLAFMKRLPTWPTFGSGWTKRVNTVQRVALGLAAGKTLPKPIPRVVKTGGAVVAGTAVATGASGLGLGLAWAAGVLVIAVAIAADMWLRKTRLGTAKATAGPGTDQEPAVVTAAAPSVTPDLDKALADVIVKKAAYDAALAEVDVQKNKVHDQIAQLNAAVAAAEAKLMTAGGGSTERPLSPSQRVPLGQ